MVISPQNYFVQNPVRQTVQQVEIDYDLDTVLNIKKFGSQDPVCTNDMVRFPRLLQPPRRSLSALLPYDQDSRDPSH